MIVQASGRHDADRENETGTQTAMHAIIKDAAFAGARELCEEFDPQKLTGAILDQSDLDKAVATGNMTRISAVATAIRRTDWRGLTPEQERKQEDERAARRRQEETLEEAEYERTMEEVREKADRLMARLEEQRRECLKRLANADARAIVLPDGRRVLVGDRPGEFIEEDTGKVLEGKDKTNAQSLQKPDSETAVEQQALRDRLVSIDSAEEHVRKAQALAGQDGNDLTTDKKKQSEAEAQKELAIAQDEAKGIPDLDAGGPDANTLSGLGLNPPANGRTTSFAATLNGKENRPASLHDQFTSVAHKADVSPAPVAAAAPSGNSVPAGTTVRTQPSRSNL